jgi:rRNA maturation RNase YbeY
MIHIEIDPEADIPDSINENEIKTILNELFRDYGVNTEEINIILVSDEYLRNLHRNYLNDDSLTDVMSFDLSDGEELTGEIYISIDRAREQAENLGLFYVDELHRYMIHGALHLCGRDDQTDELRAEMRAEEDKYLKKLDKLLKG